MMERGVVGEREVPDDEGGEPEWECNERMSKHSKGADTGHRKQRPKQRTAEARNDQQRPDVAKHEVLRHVGPEARVGQHNSAGNNPKAKVKEQLPTARHRSATQPQRPSTPSISNSTNDRRKRRKRIHYRNAIDTI